MIAALNLLSRHLVASLLGVFALFAVRSEAGEQTAVYAAAGALPGGDGTSWARAYTNLYTAVTNANALGLPLHVAGGVYVLSSTLSITNIPAIYGGFTGTNDFETVETRQYDVNRTVISGDLSGDDYWCHVVPNIGSDFGYVLTELTDKPIVSDGALNLPPAFTDDYDLYFPVIKTTNRGCALSITNGVQGVVDGLYFTGFSGDAVVKYESGTHGVDLSNCRFIGNYPVNGLVWNDDRSTEKIVSNCQFHYNRAYDSSYAYNCYGGIRYDQSGKLKLRDSSFLSCGFLDSSGRVSYYRLLDITQNGGYDWSMGLNQTIPRCQFVRCYSRSRNSSCFMLMRTYLTVSVRFTDCVFSNNLSVAAKAGLYSSTFGECNTECIGCFFKKNRYEVNLGSSDSVYLFGSYSGNNGYRHHYDKCAFVENTVYATGSTKTEGTLIVSLIGDVSDTQRTQLTNCSFDSNDIEAEVPEGVTGYKCRGIYNRCKTVNATGGASLANCTFVGPKVAGVCDVLQFDTNHSYVFNIVNCHFQYTGGEPYDDGFVFSTPDLVYLYSCTLANYVSPDVSYHINNHGYDPLLFVTNTFGLAAVPMLVPAAKTPLIRSSADVVNNGTTFSNSTDFRTKAGFMTNYAFRASGDANWQILTTTAKALDSAVASNPSALQISDANGDVRTLGSITRGAMQSLTTQAESGSTLTLRRDPFDAGSFVGPQVQCVVKGGKVSPVTAVAETARGVVFDGWYMTNGVRYSSSETLSIDKLDDSLTLVAKFATPKTKVVFELGPHATFDETGAHSCTNEISQGSVFPSVPEFTVEDGWIFNKWPTFPSVVPANDVAYTAKVVTASLRVMRVAADSTAVTPDGLSWATAYKSVAEAYEDAAIGHGEVWLKEGRHAISTPITLKSNVKLLGGFSGTETRADEADPKLHPTILNGDVVLNDTWARESIKDDVNPTHASWFVSIWKDDGSVLLPDPDFVTDHYWKPRNGADDVEHAFVSGDTAAENIGFYGLTFAGFGKSAICDTLGGETDLVVSNCQFLVNNTTDTASSAAILASARTLDVRDCFFSGNCGCIRASGTGTSIVDGCRFDANRTALSATLCAGVCLSGAQDVKIRGCSFERGYACQSYMYGAYSALELSPSAEHEALVEDTVFATNCITELAFGGISVGGAGSVSFVRCSFRDMRTLSPATTTWAYANSSVFCHSGASLTVRDSYFFRCHLTPMKESPGTPGPGGTIIYTSGGTATFLNDTFDDCSAETTHSTPAGLFASASGAAKVGIVNCLFIGARTTGERSGFYALKGDTAATSFNVLNTAVVSSSNDFTVAYLAGGAACLGFANSIIDRFDASLLPQGSNGYFYDVTTNTPVAVGELRKGANGAWARSVMAAKTGRRIWLKDGTAYFRDEVANPTKPWRKAADKGFFAASIDGLPAREKFLSDAYGSSRPSSGLAFFGPVYLKRGLILIVR